MEANELRIGNLLQRKRDYKVITVEEVLSTRICYYNPDLSSFKPIAADLNGFEPVVLTEEWLVKCGFRKMSESIYVCDTFSLLKTEFCFKYDGFTELCYVNQLQNLHFALTGEELTIK